MKSYVILSPTGDKYAFEYEQYMWVVYKKGKRIFRQRNLKDAERLVMEEIENRRMDLPVSGKR